MTRSLHVLIVEDSVDDAELLLRELRRGGYELVHDRVDTADAMRAALKRRPWQLVLSDYSMPTFSALDALALLKQESPDVPLIIISGTIGEDIAVEALKAGAQDFMVKGRLARLVPAIERELREVEARRLHREADEARRASDARFAAIMMTATDGVLSAEEGAGIDYVNPAGEKIFGYAPGELLGESLAKLFAGRDDAPFQVPDPGRTVELTGRRKGGDEFPIDLSAGRWIVEGRSRVAVIVRDVTDRKKVEAQLLVADRMVSVGTLAAGVAHEINNPLAAVMANLEIGIKVLGMIADRPGGPPELARLDQQMKDALDASERVRHIVRDLKIFSRGGEEVNGPVDVQKVMESTLRMAWNEVRHRAKVVKSYAPIPPVQASEARLGQVFLNIVVNAAQAMSEGQADRNELRVKTALEDERVVVEIADTGPGIPPEVMRRLFTPFVTTKPVGTGTGLGLSICHRIVTELGGEIGVHTNPGRGTVFRIYLPLAEEDIKASQPVVLDDGPAARRGKIMVIDDEPMIATVVQRSLASEHDVVGVHRAREALARIIAGERFDVILCDLMMPEMTGMEFHGELMRRVPAQAEALIFVSGGAFTPRARDFLEQVPNQRIEKPFDTRRLRALVNARLGRG